MLRRTNQQQFRTLVQAARQHIPDVSITTDVIVGFPGETEEEFEISRKFIAEMDFAGLHVFRYSKRPGTAAGRMRGHVDEAVKRTRSANLHELSDSMEAKFAERFISGIVSVLWEQVAGATQDGFMNVGYTDNYIWVACVHRNVLTNQITQARMLEYDPVRPLMLVEPVIV
jgi:threonylcarbamoyladenosine tRNA methylthiotransferase MtaB